MTGRRWPSYRRSMRRIARGSPGTTVAFSKYPSSTRTRAICSFCRDHGTSTEAFRAVFAFRTRVRRSAMGSLVMARSPARLGEPGDLPLPGEVAKTETAHPEAPEERTRAAAERAAVVCPHLELRGPRRLHHQCSLRQRPLLGPEGHPERPEQRFRLRVGARRGAHDDCEAFDLLDLVEVDLREDHLLPQTERVIAAPVERPVGNALEVPHPRQRHVHEPVEELVHPLAAQ